MPDIKTRETVKNIKIIDKAAVASEHIRSAFIRTKDQTQSLMEDGHASPQEYAEDQIRYVAEDSARDIGHEVSINTKRAIEKAKEKRWKHQAKQSAAKKANNEPVKTFEKTSRRELEVTRTRHAHHHAIKTRKQPAKTIKQTAKSTGQVTAKTAKGTIKSSERAIKTAQQASKTAIKTAEASAKASRAAAQATARTAKATAHAAKVAATAIVTAAKAAAKAIAAAAKVIAEAIKELIAAIAAGGWVAVLIVVVICMIGAIIAYFGIFFSSEDTGSTKTMQMVVQEINQEYQDKIDRIKTSVTYDTLEMSGSMAVWPEVLAVYSVKVTSDPDNPQETATITDEKEQLLRDIFWQMNTISHTVSTKEVTQIIETDDGNGNIVEQEVVVTKTTLKIVVSHKSAEQMAAKLSFDEEQKKHLHVLLEEGTAGMWAAVLYGIYGEDGQIIAVAISQIGNVGGMPYWSWYGFGSRVPWCACFVSWCANECGYIDVGVIPKFAGCDNGVRWFKNRDQWADRQLTPAPGMIIFFDWDTNGGLPGGQDGLSDHVGIVEKVENGKVYTVEGNSGDSVRTREYAIGHYEILGYGVPAY